jgi:hypothetical protein
MGTGFAHPKIKREAPKRLIRIITPGKRIDPIGSR